MDNWKGCKNILCIRADNMGDLLMSFPAIHALKESFKCKLTVLTSSMATGIAHLNPDIDETITFNLPWIKDGSGNDQEGIEQLLPLLRKANFDGCIIFTVYSQNPMPAVMLAYLAGIPRRLSYCREHPYALLSHWVPDPEPYDYIRHQVQRDLDLVAHIGAKTTNHQIQLQLPPDSWDQVLKQALKVGVNLERSFLVLHPGVSEPKRAYPIKEWINCGKALAAVFGMPLILTGNEAEKEMANEIQVGIGAAAYNFCGLLGISGFAALLDHAQVVISVNTGTVHLAAALQTPVVVLYAQSNPQHTPWMVPHKVLYYSIPAKNQSKNKVIEFVNRQHYTTPVPLPESNEVLQAVYSLLSLGQKRA